MALKGIIDMAAVGRNRQTKNEDKGLKLMLANTRPVATQFCFRKWDFEVEP